MKYSVLEWILMGVLALFMFVSVDQNHTIAMQRQLIKEMVTDPACMGAPPVLQYHQFVVPQGSLPQDN